MASNRNDKASKEPSQRQETTSDESDFQESTNDQWKRAVKESSRILKDITGNPKGLLQTLGSSWSKKTRIPRLYRINQDKSVLIILQGDITKTKVDAIVNAANEHMTGGSGVDGIIHRAAGDELYRDCKAHKQIYPGVRLPTGRSRILLSHDMSSTTHYIINTAGPMYNSREKEVCAKELASCYETALALAHLYDLESVGFTAISCGIFGYPADDGADVALRTVAKNAASVAVVVFVLWDDHIYDAWVDKAEELDLKKYDPHSLDVAKQAQPEEEEHQKKSTEHPPTDNDQRQSSTEFGPRVHDLSTPNNIEDLVKRLPSVPGKPSDTQSTETMDDDDGSTGHHPPLTSHNTAEMTDVTSGEDRTTTSGNHDPKRTSAEADKSHDEKTETEKVEKKSDDRITTESTAGRDRKKTK